MATSTGTTGQKQRKRRSALYAPVVFLVMCAAGIFAMSIFFRVSVIEVTGNSIYTSEEVEAAAGIEKGDNLFFLNRFTAVSRMRSRLPYIEEATVTRSLPNKITIKVSESRAIAYVSLEAQDWAVDRSCKLLKIASAEECESLIRVTGIAPVNPAVGELVVPEDGDTLKTPYLSDILDQIQRRSLEGAVTYIDMTASANPTMDFMERFTVRLGTSEDTEYKFGVLLGAVEKLAAGDTGIIDLSVDKNPHFIPQ